MISFKDLQTAYDMYKNKDSENKTFSNFFKFTYSAHTKFELTQFNNLTHGFE